VQADEEVGKEYVFVKSGEKVYRRVGSGDFGRIPTMLRQDKLLTALSTYPDSQVTNEKVLQNGFKRREEGFEEFVLI
jgi:hypothetical protein